MIPKLILFTVANFGEAFITISRIRNSKAAKRKKKLTNTFK